MEYKIEISIAKTNSFIGYVIGILALQALHLPPSISQERSGILSNHLIDLRHEGQKLGGKKRDFFLGIL